MEIEKKFQLKNIPVNLDAYEKKEIEQGYLCTGPVVRIRKSNEHYILTCKSNHVRSENKLRMCDEIEIPLTKEAYLHLREKADNHMISKTRYIIPLGDGHVGELDVFHGLLEGLMFIEVEFADVKDAKSFVPPDWFGENVSEDERYTNSFLSCCDSLSVFSSGVLQ